MAAATLRRLGKAWTPRIEAVIEQAGGPELLARAREHDVAPALARWLDLAVEWNARIDLTAARTPGELVDLFVADAAAIAGSAIHHADLDGPWVDVGSGAGAPGLAVALLVRRPMTLIEPKAKRVAFLRSVIGQLPDSPVTVVRGRVEDVSPGAFEVATSRATLAPVDWLEAGARIARTAVWLLLARDEPPEMPRWRVAVDRRYTLVETGAPRRALCYVRED